MAEIKSSDVIEDKASTWMDRWMAGSIFHKGDEHKSHSGPSQNMSCQLYPGPIFYLS